LQIAKSTDYLESDDFVPILYYGYIYF